jgi:3-hydroxymyristoyl/3-hydroxydecanoyl-(acyl carrier protein) dehydratase
MTAPLRNSFEFAVPSGHPALPGHFPGRPIVPGVLLLDHVLTGVQARVARPTATLQQVKFASALLPDETACVTFEANADRVTFSVEVHRDGVPVTLARGSLLLMAEASR